MIAGTTQESKSTLGGLAGGAEFDANGLPMKVREVLLHLTIENEGDVGVEFLLKLKELALSMFPRTGLEHRKDQDILTGIMRKGIEHACALHPRTRRRRIRAGQIFAEGNHM